MSNPLSAICNNDDYNRSTRLLAATTLRNVLGTRNLSEILSDREAIADTMHQSLVSVECGVIAPIIWQYLYLLVLFICAFHRCIANDQCLKMLLHPKIYSIQNIFKKSV